MCGALPPPHRRRSERPSSVAIGQEPLNRSNGFADVTDAQAARSEWTAAVFAERRKGLEGTGDTVGHPGQLAPAGNDPVDDTSGTTKAQVADLGLHVVARAGLHP